MTGWHAALVILVPAKGGTEPLQQYDCLLCYDRSNGNLGGHLMTVHQHG
jgi:hypothetical protein